MDVYIGSGGGRGRDGDDDEDGDGGGDEEGDGVGDGDEDDEKDGHGDCGGDGDGISDGVGDGSDDVDGGGDQSSEAQEPHVIRARIRWLCWRLPAIAGKGRWLIAGPILDHKKVDPCLFAHIVLVEGLPKFSSREVYLRALPMMVRKEMYTSAHAAHESVKRVSAEHDGASTSEPSWGGNMDKEIPLRLILDKAAHLMNPARRRVAEGSVNFTAFKPMR